MRGYFPVDIRDEEHTGLVADYRFLFKSPGAISTADLTDCLEKSLRRVLTPDALVFTCIHKETTQLVDAFKNDTGIKQALERASSKICIAVCALDSSGHIGQPIYIKNAREELPLLAEDKQGLIFKRGIHQLFESQNVLCPAPAGFAFVKPSKKRSKYFLRAEAALYETERVHFLAFALLNKIAKREKETKSPIEIIFIDTMAISSVAYVLRELYHELYDCPKPRVESFHSYEGMKNIRKPLPGTSICIVSASSSMSMHKDWWQMTRCFPSEVITLVTFKNAENSEQAIYAFDKTDPLADRIESHRLRDIRINGESFTPEEVPLKSVLLTVTYHKNKRWFEVGQLYSKDNLFSLMRAANATDKKSRQIFVDGMKLLEHDGFKKFLKKEICQKVPLSVQAIVYQDDPASKKLAEECADQINKMREWNDILIISSNELSKPLPNKEGALLIVAAVIGRGTKLLSISRDLRDIHFGARHYLAGFQLGESIDDREQLEKNLKFSALKSSISVSIMESLSIGRTISNSYEEEENLLSKWPSLSSLPKIRDRVLNLKRRSGISNDAFLPSSIPDDDSLKLRSDFAYWKSGYDSDHDHSIAVLLTAASMLQYAREFKDFEDDDHRLASDTFQQVVLDPENFARYNDGVIQAALLRAARPSELDYSSSEEYSRRMTDMLSGIFRQNSRQQGEAALEFAFALRTERLKLAKEDHQRINQVIKALPVNAKFSRLLKDLLDDEVANTWGIEASI